MMNVTEIEAAKDHILFLSGSTLVAEIGYVGDRHLFDVILRTLPEATKIRIKHADWDGGLKASREVVAKYLKAIGASLADPEINENSMMGTPLDHIPNTPGLYLFWCDEIGYNCGLKSKLSYWQIIQVVAYNDIRVVHPAARTITILDVNANGHALTTTQINSSSTEIVCIPLTFPTVPQATRFDRT